MKEEVLTPEEIESKRKSRNRLFGLLVFVDIAFLGYLIYEIIILFVK